MLNVAGNEEDESIPGMVRLVKCEIAQDINLRMIRHGVREMNSTNSPATRIGLFVHIHLLKIEKSILRENLREAFKEMEKYNWD